MTELTEGNKLIAEFMEIKKCIEHTDCYFFDGQYSRIDMARYESDWNWIMPVITKIHGVLRGDISDGSFAGEARIQNSLYPPDIKACWIAVVQFIQWHNDKE